MWSDCKHRIAGQDSHAGLGAVQGEKGLFTAPGEICSYSECGEWVPGIWRKGPGQTGGGPGRSMQRRWRTMIRKWTRQHRKATSERAWAALFEVSTTIQPETISRDVQRVSGVQDGTDTQTTPLWSDKVSKATRAANGKPWQSESSECFQLNADSTTHTHCEVYRTILWKKEKRPESVHVLLV